jgi:hypothetical protein
MHGDCMTCWAMSCEWCMDAHSSYSGSGGILVDPLTVGSRRDSRIYRGGSWNSSPRFVRSASRFVPHPDPSYFDLGFRLVRGQGPEIPWVDAATSDWEDLDVMREVLLRAGRIYLRAESESGFQRRQVSDAAAALKLSRALNDVVDGIVTTKRPIKRESTILYVDIVIFDANEAPLCVVEIKRTGIPGLEASRTIERGIAQVEEYVSLAGAMVGAMVLLLSLPDGAKEPRIETLKAPGGLDVLVLHL